MASSGGGNGGGSGELRNKEVLQSVSKRLANCEHVGLQKKRILREDEIFDPTDPKIREVHIVSCVVCRVSWCRVSCVVLHCSHHAPLSSIGSRTSSA